MDEQKAAQALQILAKSYPDARPALHYSTAYELLVAVILSAQCTDERVNIVTAELFKEHNTPRTMLALSQQQLEGYIFSCGLYRSKAAHILSAIAVDTHVFGVSNRVGLAHAATPAKTEEQLKQIIPQQDWSKAHHWLIWHGRRVCHARQPDCAACPLAEVCDHFSEREEK